MHTQCTGAAPLPPIRQIFFPTFFGCRKRTTLLLASRCFCTFEMDKFLFFSPAEMKSLFQNLKLEPRENFVNFQMSTFRTRQRSRGWKTRVGGGNIEPKKIRPSHRLVCFARSYSCLLLRETFFFARRKVCSCMYTLLSLGCFFFTSAKIWK